MKWKWTSLVALALSSTLAFAGHPASDRVIDALEEGFRILDYSGTAQTRAMCRFVTRYLDHQNIGVRLLGTYARSSDQAGVREFLRESPSLMVTKALPKLKDLNGQSGTYSVSDRVSRRSDGSFAVPVTIRTSKGKTYNGRAIVSSSMYLVDIEYMGFSGVNYIGREVKKEIDRFRSSSTPVTAFMRDIKSKKDYVNCP